MNAPLASTATGLAPLLAALAVFCTTARARTLTAVWRLPVSPIPLLGAWLAPGFWFCATPSDGEAFVDAARTLTAAGYTLADPPPKAVDALAPVLKNDRPQYLHDAAALGAFVESLPAIVSHIELWNPGDSARRVIDAAHLRAMLRGVAGRVSVSRAVYRDTTRGNVNASALVFEGETWRAMLRSYDADAITPIAPRFDPARPFALACGLCGVVASTRFETADAAHTEALARRWTLRDTDEGETYACRPCAKRGA